MINFFKKLEGRSQFYLSVFLQARWLLAIFATPAKAKVQYFVAFLAIFSS